MVVQSDEMVMASLAQGGKGLDDSALRLLYERHAPAMLRLLRRLTSNQAVAEEILQEAWVAVWQSAGGYRADSSVRAWLLGVARRQAHNRIRRKEVLAVELDEAVAVADPDEDVEARVLAKAGHEEVMSRILALPEHLREVVILALVDELPYKDVSTVLGIPVGTVKSRMAHARARLSAALAGNTSGNRVQK
jgi:RNA polymerase sigma-70 factor (ECF subfamily)